MAVRKYTPFIFVTLVNCCLGIVVCGVALGTDFWFHGSATQNGNIKVSLRYGLFKGQKTTEVLNMPSGFVIDSDLRLVCLDGLCMYSCGPTKEFRELDLENVRRSGKWGPLICQTGEISGQEPTEAVKDSDFIKFGLWLATIFFLSVAIVFFALAGLLALYNSFRVPIQPIFSVFGLYIWNGVAAICVLCGLILWGVLFGNTLKNNSNVSETLHGDFKQDVKGTLGFSFWVLLLAEIFALLNIGILRLRSWKISKSTAVNEKISPVANGDVLLF